MAEQSVATKIDRITAAMAGVGAFLSDLVQTDDMSKSNQAFAMADLVSRLQVDLDQIAEQMREEG